MKNTQQQQAKELYTTTTRSKKEIAHTVGVDEKTIRRWINKEAWDALRQSVYQTPAVIVNNMCRHLVQLQNNIAVRREVARYPSEIEMETTRKLVSCIIKLKDYPSRGANIQVMNAFSSFVSSDQQFCEKLLRYTALFFEAKDSCGRHAYQLDYGMEPLIAEQADMDALSEEMEEIKAAAGAQAPQTPLQEAGTQAEEMSGPEEKNIPDISTVQNAATLAGQAIEPVPENVHNSPETDIYGHSAALSPPPPPYPALSGGITYVSRGNVYDPSLNRLRPISMTELEQYEKLGFGLSKLKF